MGTTASISIQPYVAPFAAETITYSLGGVEHTGRKTFTQTEDGYSEVIRDLQGNVIVGAIEVLPTIAAPIQFTKLGFEELFVTGDTVTITNAHSVTVATDGSVEVTSTTHNQVYNIGEIMDVKATPDTAILEPITITSLGGAAKIHYTYS